MIEPIFDLDETRLNRRKRGIPCIFPVDQGSFGREGFAWDCAIRHALLDVGDPLAEFANNRRKSWV